MDLYNKNHCLNCVLLLIITVVASTAYAEVDKLELYGGYKFALGVGAAIVKFDTKIKITDKQNG